MDPLLPVAVPCVSPTPMQKLGISFRQLTIRKSKVACHWVIGFDVMEKLLT